MIGSYTFSRLVHNNETSYVNYSYFHNGDVNYRSISSLDQPHLFRLGMTYAMRGGFQITNYLTLESGLPLNITGTNGRPIITGDPAKDGPANARLGDVLVNGVPQNPYFNTSVFQQLPSQFYPGNISPTPPFRTDLRAPGMRSLNTSLLKTFPETRGCGRVAAEAFNVTNHPFFNAPGTNSAQPGSFGVITGASNSRQMQVGVKLKF